MYKARIHRVDPPKLSEMRIETFGEIELQAFRIVDADDLDDVFGNSAEPDTPGDPALQNGSKGARLVGTNVQHPVNMDEALRCFEHPGIGGWPVAGRVAAAWRITRPPLKMALTDISEESGSVTWTKSEVP